ncbi:haspin like kinase domain-containing protein [Ditylenchus destructor]|nr:haspin like kinase domain-containing protein [Ditylenchus destructor]
MPLPKNEFGVPKESAKAEKNELQKLKNMLSDIHAAIGGNPVKQQNFARPILDQFQVMPGQQPEQVDEEPAQVNTLDGLLQLCGQVDCDTWNTLMDDGAEWSKLSEGSYSDVYSRLIDGENEISPFFDPAAETKKKAGKGKKGRKSERFGHNPVAAVAPEVAIAKALSSLNVADYSLLRDVGTYACSGFVRLISARVVKGPIEKPVCGKLLDAYDRFLQAHKDDPDVQNPRPTAYQTKDQLYLIQILGHAGNYDLQRWLGLPADLKKEKLVREIQAGSIFFQAALSLAIAEEQMEFEHRDLHLSNLMVKTSPKDDSKNTAKELPYVSFVFNGTQMKVKKCGVVATVIDYTHSRVRAGELLFYSNMGADAGLFNQPGTQQGVYTAMQLRNGDNWANFTPRTNVLWLRYLASKLFVNYDEDSGRLRDNILRRLDNAERIKDFMAQPLIKDIFYKYLFQY